MLNIFGGLVRKLRREEELKQARERLAEQEQRINELERRDTVGVDPANIVWIFGAGRTGSTWLARMMQDLKWHTLWNEPLLGYLFGHVYYERGDHRHHARGFILGGERESWLGPMRDFILGVAAAKFPRNAENPSRYLVIKEPHGSIGAPLVMEALPESRMVFLIRDPRDVMASKLDAHSPEGWAGKVKGRKRHAADVESMASGYVRDIGHTREAFEAHKGRKAMVRYEDLRADAFGTMKRIYAELEMPVEEEKLAEVVEKHSWENIPEEEKGEGKIRRKAKPGGWREDLTEEQIEAVERITAPLIGEFYPEVPR